MAHKSLNVIDTDISPPGCAGPPDPKRLSMYLDSGASVTVLGAAAAADVAEIQRPNYALNTPSHVPTYTSKTLELHLKKLPKKAREAFRVNDVPHNLVDVATLIDAGQGAACTCTIGASKSITPEDNLHGLESAKLQAL